ncbi:RDD family protein [Actinopolymorpha rutila]|uniref:Putative RDD family membrane protein YckC n=1 Tax=Actinopolymorpha rutila TaxID=446787 RepID=A0A852ZJ93_9ACTN|nr:RDD family protein [Actinopolymorpha rutila]NYH93171.1 putative RDD family membrane protein YckC [Actinopolymorpha rutila]
MGESTAWRRVAATALDYAVILGYVGILVGVGFTARALGVAPEVSGVSGRVLAQLAASLLLSVPVTTWLAVQEARRGATVGKRMLAVEVRRTPDGRVGFPRAAARNALKVLLPWELAHTAIWDLTLRIGSPVVDAVLLGAVYVLAAAYVVGVFWRSGRTPYDRLAGTTVVRCHSRAR